MTPERYEQIGSLFEAALACPEAERQAWLDAACAGDEQLRVEVERLLAHHSQAEDFLVRPALQLAARQMAQHQRRLIAGRQLKHYRLLAPLGAGGMGEVWLARDTQLERNVALKLLPAAFTHSQTHLRRFAQEAKAASALSHPNIITIHEIGEVADDSGVTHYIVTEYVEGQTLRQLVAERMPLTEALSVAVQVADALVAAHQAGIIHRDLKPENVMVRPDGLVKVLDFGLAKLLGQDEGEERGGAAEVWDETDLAALPAPRQGLSASFIAIAGGTRPSISLTNPGTVMGTVSYMSPEQTLAQPLDQRSDIFSFGVLLYEMLTGQRPFRGLNAEEIYAAILQHIPAPVTKLQPGLPLEMQAIIERTLAKQPEQRFQTAAELRLALKMLEQTSGANAVAVVSGGAGNLNVRRYWRKVVLLAGVLSALGLAGYWLWGSAPKAPPLTLQAANFTQLTSAPGQEIYPSLSSDGQTLLFASDVMGDMDIYRQQVSGGPLINLTQVAPAQTDRALPALSAPNDTQPAFSPDAQLIAFRSDREGGGIFVMSATGNQLRRLVDYGHNPAWSPDGKEIAFSKGSFGRPSERGNYPGPLFAVRLDNGQVRQITVMDAVQPSWSPHGNRIAFWGIQQGGQRDLWTVAAQGGEPVRLTTDAALDWNPLWSPDGRFLYFASDRSGSMNLWRLPLDEHSGALLGVPEPVTAPATYTGYLSLSRDGRYLAYAQLVQHINLQQVSFDPVNAKLTSKPVWITQGSRIATDPSFSPDNEWVVFGATGDQQEDISVARRDGTGLRKLTNDKFKDRAPQWSPDGRQIVFFSDRSGDYQYWLINPDGSGLRQFSELNGMRAQLPRWSPDGMRLLCNVSSPAAVWLADPRQRWSAQTPVVLPAAGVALNLLMTSWSKDGRKLAGFDGGVYSYDFDTQRYAQLTEFGDYPVWLPDSRRLLFYRQDRLYVLDSLTQQTQELLSVAPMRFQSLNLSRDGQVIYFSLKTAEADIWLADLQSQR